MQNSSLLGRWGGSVCFQRAQPQDKIVRVDSILDKRSASAPIGESMSVKVSLTGIYLARQGRDGVGVYCGVFRPRQPLQRSFMPRVLYACGWLCESRGKGALRVFSHGGVPPAQFNPRFALTRAKRAFCEKDCSRRFAAGAVLASTAGRSIAESAVA